LSGGNLSSLSTRLGLFSPRAFFCVQLLLPSAPGRPVESSGLALPWVFPIGFLRGGHSPSGRNCTAPFPSFFTLGLVGFVLRLGFPASPLSVEIDFGSEHSFLWPPLPFDDPSANFESFLSFATSRPSLPSFGFADFPFLTISQVLFLPYQIPTERVSPAF